MSQLKDDVLCKYCFGCNKLENQNFLGVRNCKNFVSGYKNWREMYDKALNRNLNFKNKHNLEKNGVK